MRNKWTLWLIVALAFLLCLVAGGLALLFRPGIQVTITNTGATPMRSVVLHDTGASYPLGDTQPGESATAQVRLASDCGLEIEFMDAVGNVQRLNAGGYFEPIHAISLLLSIEFWQPVIGTRLHASAEESVLVPATSEDTLLARAAMVMEELAEWLSVVLIAAADAWGDRTYVLFGDVVLAGLPAAGLFAEVYRSNMSKEPDSAGSGKAVKKISWEPPLIFAILQNATD